MARQYRFYSQLRFQTPLVAWKYAQAMIIGFLEMAKVMLFWQMLFLCGGLAAGTIDLHPSFDGAQ